MTADRQTPGKPGHLAFLSLVNASRGTVLTCSLGYESPWWDAAGMMWWESTGASIGRWPQGISGEPVSYHPSNLLTVPCCCLILILWGISIPSSCALALGQKSQLLSKHCNGFQQPSRTRHCATWHRHRTEISSHVYMGDAGSCAEISALVGFPIPGVPLAASGAGCLDCGWGCFHRGGCRGRLGTAGSFPVQLQLL